MARALVEVWCHAAPDERAAFFERARARQAALQAIGVSFWVFERSDTPGELVQYVEAKDPARLQEARAIIGVVAGEREILLHQLEL